MFDSLLVMSSAKKIKLQTHLGRDVDNDIAPNVDARQERVYKLMRTNCGSNWENRKKACGIYNCFGHVFANRRTSIREDQEVKNILNDDGYRCLSQSEQPYLGDIVIYLERSNNSMLHAAMIIRLNEIKAGENISNKIPYVLSKWDDKSGEDIHAIMDIPFRKSNGFDVYTQIWTDRP